MAIAKLADGSLLDIKLKLLENAGHARELISSPSLFTANQQLASIEAGEEVLYQGSRVRSGGTAVVFKKGSIRAESAAANIAGKECLIATAGKSG